MKLFLCLLTLVPSTLCLAQEKLTVETIFGGETGLGSLESTPTWRPDGTHYLRFERERGWLSVAAADERETVHIGIENLRTAFAALPGFSDEDAVSLAGRSWVTWSEDQEKILYNTRNDLFVYLCDQKRVVRLTHDAADEVGEDFSPDGSMVSFIRDYNIHLVDLDSLRVRQITRDGNKSLLYGRLDWVYQEEIYGRGNFRGYWWSPDSQSFAFLRIDESRVPTYTVVDHLPYHPELEVTHYPKAGDPNPTVQIGVVPSGGGEITWMDTFGYEGGEFLVVRVAWHPDSAMFTAQIQNREQNWLDLIAFDPDSGKGKRLLRETSETWVDVIDVPRWTPDGDRFVWSSERDGWMHLYLYDKDGKLVRRLTEGEWEASQGHGFDTGGAYFYYSENKGNILERHFSRVALADGKSKRLTEAAGYHGVSPAPGGAYFFDRYSAHDQAGTLELRKGDGTLVRGIDRIDMKPLEAYGLSPIEFLKVKTRDDFEMEAMMIKPPDFDPGKRYPVWSYTYGGPHAPSVRNRWGGSRYLWHQMLARELDCIIWICDNRTASGKGKVSVDPLYRNFGELELRDLEDGVAWLKQQPYVDPDRIGIWGWSYGGYMTLYALTNSTAFSVGISGAPVTDWRNYDTIYTERYMAMPQNNERGYQVSSPVHSAADLHGDLLIIHGTMDDNVHMQQTIQMINALQDAGKSFEMMLYPRARHGVHKASHRLHLYETMTDFLRRHL